EEENMTRFPAATRIFGSPSTFRELVLNFVTSATTRCSRLQCRPQERAVGRLSRLTLVFRQGSVPNLSLFRLVIAVYNARHTPAVSFQESMMSSMSTSRLLCASLMFLVLSIFATSAAAQGVTSASIAGVVTDPQKAVMPGVNIVALHEPSGTTYETVTRA